MYAENHSNMNCKTGKDEPVKCVRCEERHSAGYNGCRVYQEIISFPVFLLQKFCNLIVEHLSLKIIATTL